MTMNASGGWSSADYVVRASRIALDRLTSALVAHMRDGWGAAWPERLNEAIREADERKRARFPDWRSRPPVRVSGEKIDWDLAALTNNIHDLALALPRLRRWARDIKTASDRAKTVRNRHAHVTTVFDIHDVERARNEILTLAGFVDLVAGSAAAKDVSSIADEMLATLMERAEAPPTEAVPASELAQIKQLLAELLSRHSAAPAVAPEPAHPVDLSTAIPAFPKRAPSAAASPFPSERLSRSDQGLVLFPIVSGSGEPGAFATVRAVHAPASVQGHLATTISVGSDQRNALNGAIEAARSAQSEQAPGSAPDLTRVVFKFQPSDFQGASFLLAAAIADRALRQGVAPALARRPLIATGLVPRHGHGSVEPIDHFAAKVALVEETAPPDAVFVYPAANAAEADGATAGGLERLRERGVLLRPVTRLDELDDLFASPKDTAGAAAAPARGKDAASPVPASAPSRRRLAPAAAAILGGAVLVLGGLYGAGSLRETARVDPITSQASAERLGAVLAAAADVGAAPRDVATCRVLVEAASGIRDVDRDRASPEHLRALGLARSCADAIEASDARWDALARAGSSGREVADAEALASARAALLPFDLDRGGEPGRADLLRRADDASTAIVESDRRLARLSDAVATWRAAPETDAIDAVAAADADLRDLDRARADTRRRADLEAAAAARKAIEASDHRLRIVEEALAGLRAAPSTEAAHSLERASEAMTPLDRARAPQALRAALADRARIVASARLAAFDAAIAALRRAGADDAALDTALAVLRALADADRAAMTDAQRADATRLREFEIERLASKRRLDRLREAELAFETAQRTGSGLPQAADALIAAADALRPVDRARAGGADRVAMAAAARARAERDDGARRVAAVVRLAERMLATGGQPTVEIARALADAFNALTPVDLARLAPDERTLVDRACGTTIAAPSLAPTFGTIAPRSWCVDAAASFGAPVLPPSTSLR